MCTFYVCRLFKVTLLFLIVNKSLSIFLFSITRLFFSLSPHLSFSPKNFHTSFTSFLHLYLCPFLTHTLSPFHLLSFSISFFFTSPPFYFSDSLYFTLFSLSLSYHFLSLSSSLSLSHFPPLIFSIAFSHFSLSLVYFHSLTFSHSHSFFLTFSFFPSPSLPLLLSISQISRSFSLSHSPYPSPCPCLTKARS